jgi:hypothetical protein
LEQKYGGKRTKKARLVGRATLMIGEKVGWYFS